MIQADAEVILDKIILLYPEDSKTNVCIPFSLQKNYRALEFICSYEPKKCEDKEKAKELLLAGIETYIPAEYRESSAALEDFLAAVVNLVTFSLDCSGQYLGCAHRHANEQRHIVSMDFSSPGFFCHAPAAGDWRAVINVHAVVSPEVQYHLQILAHQ